MKISVTNNSQGLPKGYEEDLSNPGQWQGERGSALRTLLLGDSVYSITIIHSDGSWGTYTKDHEPAGALKEMLATGVST